LAGGHTLPKKGAGYPSLLKNKLRY
jgi:hypothetical protein